MSPDDALYQWVLPLAVAGIAYAVWWHFFWGNLKITVRNGNVEVAGKALAAKAVRVRNFWNEQMSDVPRAWVQGQWDGRRLRLRYSSRLTIGERQRIRNYLMTIL
jgi:hypothetical protein